MKITKQRLQELASINTNVNEAISRNGNVTLPVTINIGDLIDLFGGGEEFDPSIMTDPNKFRDFTRIAAADLGDWLVEPNPQTGHMSGREWASDGIDSGTYDDFLASDDDQEGEDSYPWGR